MVESPLECTVFHKILPSRLGKQCHTCRRVYPLSRFERRVWSTADERLVVQEGRVCYDCSPPTAFDMMDFKALSLRRLQEVVQNGLVRTGQAMVLLEAARARKRIKHAAKIGDNEFRKWSAPWDHALRRLKEERRWAAQRRRYMQSPRFKHMAAPADAFFSAYLVQLAKLKGWMVLQRRRPEYAKSPRLDKVMQPASMWAHYMVDKERRTLEQLYWALLCINGNALGKHAAPLLLDTAPESAPMHGYMGVPEAVPVTQEVPKRPHLRNMARSTLTVERVRELLDYDPGTGHLTWREQRRGAARAGERAGSAMQTGYRSVCVDGVLVPDAHLAWLHSYGRWPVSRLFRRNGVPDDNRLVNLYERTTRGTT